MTRSSQLLAATVRATLATPLPPEQRMSMITLAVVTAANEGSVGLAALLSGSLNDAPRALLRQIYRGEPNSGPPGVGRGEGRPGGGLRRGHRTRAQ
jgi:hypothetical protein